MSRLGLEISRGYSMIKSLLLILATVFILSGCDDDGDIHASQGVIAAPLSCNAESEKQFVQSVMHDTYLWYQDVPSVDLSQFATAADLLDGLRVSPDRFSYIAPKLTHDAFFDQGTFEGFGFSSAISASNDSYIFRYVFDDSPAGAVGLQRSDRIIAVNGISAAQLIAGEGLSSFLSTFVLGDSVTFSIQSLAAVTPTDIDLVKRLVIMNTVLHAEVVNNSGLSIGYIAISNFIDNTSIEFANAIAQFNQTGINELVLDLRYNTGGRVAASNDVASSIGGGSVQTYNFTQVLHNDKYASSNAIIPFSNFDDVLSLSRVYVLTSASTCSASELVINSLSPLIEVILIGDTTCGKPIGMYGKEFCEKIILPIEFQTVNHFSEGEYFDGLVANCTQADDLDKLFADPQEAMFAHAIYHMNNNACQLPLLKPVVPIQTNQSSKQTTQSIIDPMFNKY